MVIVANLVATNFISLINMLHLPSTC